MVIELILKQLHRPKVNLGHQRIPALFILLVKPIRPSCRARSANANSILRRSPYSMDGATLQITEFNKSIIKFPSIKRFRLYSNMGWIAP
jgi:hypothetical protein